MPAAEDLPVLVTPAWLKRNIDRKDLLVVDCRYRLTDTSFGHNAYLQSHLPGAIFLDLNEDMSGRIKKHGGRHPVPNKNEFIQLAEKIGLCDDYTIVAYDDDGSGAARLYWLLRYYGHNDIHILNGGINSWAREGLPLTRRQPDHRECDFTPRIASNINISMRKVRDHLGKIDLIDCRAERRYLGLEEPIDRKAGHIPGARNLFYQNLLAPDNSFRPLEELHSILSQVSEKPVFYCGSGVTSCVAFVAAMIIGKNPVLYAGSWSDWISYDDNPIETA
ncbi:MAG: sulfurtransferase [Thermoplasmataceae archaeon]